MNITLKQAEQINKICPGNEKAQTGTILYNLQQAISQDALTDEQVKDLNKICPAFNKANIGDALNGLIAGGGGPTPGNLNSAPPFSSINQPDVVWTNPTRLETEDDTPAYATIPQTSSGSLYVVGMGWSIPVDATILGIGLRIRAKVELGGGDEVNFAFVQLAVSGSRTGDNLGASTPITDIEYTDYSFGGASELWSLALTPAILNDGDFGLFMQFNNTAFSDFLAEVDFVEMTAYYTTPGGGSSVEPLSQTQIASLNTCCPELKKILFGDSLQDLITA